MCTFVYGQTVNTKNLQLVSSNVYITKYITPNIITSALDNQH